MGRRDDLIQKYVADIKNKFGEEPDMALLTKVTVGLGPSIYNQDSSKVSGTNEKELETVKQNFLINKLGLADGPALMQAIQGVITRYGASEKNKQRAVIYYMLARHFGKQDVYDK